MTIIPAIDLIDGKCVRLAKGDFDKKNIYHDDPVEVAKSFESHGVRRLHIVDLDGARGKSLQNLSVLEKVAASTNLEIDFGGGIKKTEEVRSVLNAGAIKISMGSIVVKDAELFSSWLTTFGADKFFPGADVLNEQIRINGWMDEGGFDIFSFIQNLMSQGVSEIFCKDISRDGMLQGPSIGLYKKVLKSFPQLHLVASGGVAKFEDLQALKEVGCSGAIVGKAIYEGKISLSQIEQFINFQ